MQSKVFASLIVALSFTLATAPGYAQLAADFMSYQGQLKSSGGDPVPDDNYSLVFTVWDLPVSGTMVWSEEQNVETSDGSFQVNLGSISPLDQDVFGGTTNPASRWLQIQVAGDDPMTPRIELGVNPFAFISTRLYGDVKTEPGKLSVGEENNAQVVISNPSDQVAEISLLVGDEGGKTVEIKASATGGSISLADPRPSPTFSTIKMEGNDSGGSISLADPRPSPSFAKIDIYSGDGTGSISLADPRPSPTFATIMMKGDNSGGSISLADPRPSPTFASIDIFSGDGNGAISLADPRPSPTFADVTISGDATGSGILLADPRPSPSFASLELRSEVSGASIALADPRPSPSVPDLLLLSDEQGSQMAFGEMGNLGLIEDEVMVFSATNEKGQIGIYSPGNEQVVDIVGDLDGGNISLIGDSPLAPSVNIIADQTGATIDLTCDSDEKPKVEIATDCTGANIAFSFGGDVGLQPSVDMGINNISSYLSLLVGSEQQPVVDFLADADGGSLGLSEYNSLAKTEMYPKGTYLYDSEGNLAVEVELVALTMYDVNSAAKTVMHAGGVNLYTEDGELEAVFEPNGVVAPKGNFGSGNTNAGTNTLVVGSSNSAGGNFSSVLGGSGNSAGGGSAVVCGGVGNSSSFGSAFVGGGQSNTASGLNAVVGGGNGNNATGNNSTVPGGASNVASGDYSLAGGLRARAVHQGAFVWADATGSSFSSDLVNQYKIRASGGTYIYSNSETSAGVRLSSGSSQWQSISDRNAKRNIRAVDGEEILQQLQQLPVSRWSYKDQDENIEHIGPMAQDFYALFSIGEDDRHISMLDPSGVALAGVKELISRIEELEARIAELETERR